MSCHKVLYKWFNQDWVDIGSKKKGGGHKKCGRSKQKADAKRKYPKCVPSAKANRMTAGEKRSAVSRKRAASTVGPKPTNVATFAKRSKKADGGMIKQAQQNYRGSYISGDLGGVEVSNPSLRKYYKGML